MMTFSLPVHEFLEFGIFSDSKTSSRKLFLNMEITLLDVRVFINTNLNPRCLLTFCLKNDPFHSFSSSQGIVVNNSGIYPYNRIITGSKAGSLENIFLSISKVLIISSGRLHLKPQESSHSLGNKHLCLLQQ